MAEQEGECSHAEQTTAAANDLLKVSTAQALEMMRDMNPLVQCITNFVSMDIMANALLAAGASPAMVRTFVVFSSLFETVMGQLIVTVRAYCCLYSTEVNSYKQPDVSYTSDVAFWVQHAGC
jgi:hypothetical protein